MACINSQPAFPFDDVEEEGGNDEVPDYSDSADSWEDDLSEEEDEDNEQQQNSRHLGFLLTCLSPAMDVIAIWRIPYIAYKHGGIILLPWLIMNALIGLPLTYLEMTLGQVHGGSGGGTAALASMVPFCKGLTYSVLALLTIQTLYHMTVVTWCLFYLFTSMQETLPWSQCSKTHSSEGCSSHASLVALCNGTLTNCTSFGTNSSSLELPIARSEHYFNEVMLSVTEGLQLVGPMSWKLCLCLLCAWLFVYLDVRKGKLPIRKKSILPSLIMSIVLCVMMGKATGQEGFQNGVRIYFTYEWNKLQDFRMWADVGTQLVLTLGIGTGMLQILGRRSRLAINLRQDAITVVFGNVLVAFFGGLVAFACLGYLAAQLETPYVKFLREDFGAAFVVFSAALTELPGAVVWAIFFFAILTLVSLKRQRLLVLALASTLQEILRSSTLTKRYRSLYIMLVCTFMAGLGFIFVMPVGSHILLVLDLYVIGWPSLFTGLLECIAVTWIYGSKRFCGDVKNLLQIKISKLWRVMWCVVTPTSIMVVLLFTILFDDSVQYNGLDFTLQARIIGWSLVTAVVSPTLVYAACTLLRQHLRRKPVQQGVIPTGPMSKPPHWHVLSQRRKGSITPAPKILVVKTDEQERSSPHQIPYGFVLTPSQKSSTPKLVILSIMSLRNFSKFILLQMNTSNRSLGTNNINHKMRLRSPLAGHKVAPLVPSNEKHFRDDSTELQTSIYLTPPGGAAGPSTDVM